MSRAGVGIVLQSDSGEEAGLRDSGLAGSFLFTGIDGDNFSVAIHL